MALCRRFSSPSTFPASRPHRGDDARYPPQPWDRAAEEGLGHGRAARTLRISNAVRDAYNQIKNKLTLNVSDIGEQHLKNIARQVRVYAVWLDGLLGRPTLALPDKPSIAVLPFSKHEWRS
jgi:hypothetical protein